MPDITRHQHFEEGSVLRDTGSYEYGPSIIPQNIHENVNQKKEDK